MNKLRLAVMGNNGKNLDDLSQMDGKLNPWFMIKSILLLNF